MSDMNRRNRAGDTTHHCAGGHERNHAIDLELLRTQKTTLLRARSNVKLLRYHLQGLRKHHAQNAAE